MWSYILRRLLLATFTLFVVTFIIYALLRNLPGTPLSIEMGEGDPSKQISPEHLESMKRLYQLDKPWYVAYWYWLGNVLQGNLGNSFRHRVFVTQLIADKIGPTLWLSVPSFLLTYAISIPVGLYVTRFSGTIRERIISVALYMLYSMPSYVLALWLLYWFYLRFAGTVWQLPPGMVSDHYAELSSAGKVGDLLRHLILPLFCYSYASLAYDVRFIKANMEETIRQDYIRTARAKGLDDRTILFRHAFRNTLIPFVTLIGLTLPGLISGAIILEQIFLWDGIGRLFLESLYRYDYNVIMGMTLMFSAATLAGQLTADILYAFVDPRITYQ